MGKENRLRYADPSYPRLYNVASATVIEDGDMLYLDPSNAGQVLPASSFSYVSADLVSTQKNFRADFVGIAMQSSDSGDTDPIKVGLGVFEMDAASATFNIGDWVAPDDNAGGTALVDQQIIGVTDAGLGIGRVVKQHGASTTRVLVQFESPHANAAAYGQAYKEVGFFAATIANAVDLVTNYTFGRPVRITDVIFQVSTLTAGATVLTLRKGATALDDTLTVPDAQAVGAIVSQAISDATGDDEFDATDQLDIASDGGGTAGAGMIIVRYIEL